MPTPNDPWLSTLLARNAAFRAKADPARLPVARTPGRFGLVTCMDPRLNPAALGLDGFGPDGGGGGGVRVIRTIGGMADDRSLIVGIHLAGIREFAFVTHTDCGNCLAKARIDAIADSLRATMPADDHKAFAASIGGDDPATLVAYLKAFDDPRVAVEREIAAVRRKPFVPADVILHGLVYDLSTATLELVVDGYA